MLENSDRKQVDEILAQHPNAQVRELSPNHGMYEIFGVSREELAKAAPKARLTGNSFFEFRKFSVPAPEGLEVAGLNPCREMAMGPTSVATVLEPAVADNQFSVEVGTKVVISAAQSQNAVKTALLVIPPDASSLEKGVVVGDKVEIPTDAMGAYQIFVVAQDAQDACALDGVQFVATANRSIQPVSENITVDLSKLSHLAAVGAQESWSKSTGEGVLIAIVDTGVNYNHPLLSSAIELNNADRGNDEDRNGFRGDRIGYDFVNSDPFPFDDDGHGTHVSGLAAGRQFGLANKARILAVKVLSSVGGDAGSVAAGVIYAVDRGARIINMSLGTMEPEPNPLIIRAMEYARSKNVLVVVAAGNGHPQTGLGLDIEQTPVWPASLPFENILTVAALDKNGELTSYSNFGKVSVDVAAPGGSGRDSLISCAFENPAGAKFVGMSGTSMASPVVTGIAAQVLALNPNLKPSEIKSILMRAGTETAELQAATVSGRKISAAAAVGALTPSNVLF